MIKRALQFIPVLLLLLIAGSSDQHTFRNNNINHKTFRNNNINNNSRFYSIPEERFQSSIPLKSYDKNLNTSVQIEVADNELEYFRQEEKINKKSLIRANINNEIRGNTIEIGAFYKHSPQGMTDPGSFGRISPEIYFTAIFDNDIFDYTDYYYTNGISLEFYHPGINNSPVCRILPGLKNSLNYYGLILIQNMYTPRKLEELKVRIGDRPFASYLTVTHQRISLSAVSHRRLQTELALGTIGPASLGGVAQDMIHTNTPVGWVNQVKNDVVVNYSVRFDQGIYSGNGVEVAVIAGGQAGTLYDNIMGGIYLQIGKANDCYESLFQTTPHQKTFKGRIRYYFSLDAKTRLVMYDATLQGGMFNRESVYRLNASQVRNYVFTGTASFGLGLGRYSLEAEQVFLTPEFDGGRHHFWFRIKNIFYLN